MINIAVNIALGYLAIGGMCFAVADRRRLSMLLSWPRIVMRAAQALHRDLRDIEEMRRHCR